MQIINEYYLNGTPEVDSDSPASPYQGATLIVFAKSAKTQEYIGAQYRAGQMYFGYKARRVDSAEEVAMLLARIEGVKKFPQGYADSQGTWFKGNAGDSFVSENCKRAWQHADEVRFFSEFAGQQISDLADEVLANNHPRANEYSMRYADACRYLNSTDPETGSYPYLDHMKYKGLSLKEAAELVVEKHKKAEANDAIIAELRMKKALLAGNISLREKKEIYESIIAGLKAAKI